MRAKSYKKKSFGSSPDGGSFGGGNGGGRFGSFRKRRSGGGSPSGRNKRFEGKKIQLNQLINKPKEQQEVAKYVADHTFADFGLIEKLIQNLNAKGYEHPTAIQDQSIPAVLQGRDMIGLANTGSGKTASFLLPIIQNLKTKLQPGQQALVVAPTRELAMQIENEFRSFTPDMKLYSALCVGGMSIERQKSALRRRPHLIIGTPGRLIDLMKQRCLRLDQVGMFVLDEVDRMLDMGFINDVKYLIEHLPQERQSLCYSATITNQIKQILHDLLRDPVTVSVRTSETGAHVPQDVVRYKTKEHKLEVLIGMLQKPEFEKVIIFGETKFGVQKLADKLLEANLKVEVIHGDKSQGQRRFALEQFKKDRVNILVATDVAARGIDVPNVSHVVNFEVPQTYDDYIHRIGRTARAGSGGQALTFVKESY